MARKCTNINLFQQSGNDNTIVAIWRFTAEQAVRTDYFWYKLKPGATYYNGTPIPAEYMSQSWNKISVDGDKMTLGRNVQGTLQFNGSVSTKYIEQAFGISQDVAWTLDHYDIRWEYTLGGDPKWYKGTSYSQTPSQVDTEIMTTWDFPEKANGIYFHIIPIAKTRKVNGNDVPYWNGQWADALWYMTDRRPKMPSVPDVEIDKYTLTASVENISDSRTDQIQFAIFDDNGKVDQAAARVISRRATYTTQVAPGGRYRVLCRAMNVVGSGASYSDWTDLSEAVYAVPSPPEAITTIRGSSSTSVYLAWTEVASADTYEIEYTTNANYFDGSSETTTVSDIELTHYEVTGLETGDEYFFRVRAANEQGASDWSGIESVAIGKPPIAPTTWSSSTTVITGTPLTLYWVHNAEDGSTEKYAEVEITIGSDTQTHTVRNENADDEENPDKDKTKSYVVDTTPYSEGTQIKWRVRTSGVTNEYGDWSIMRIVDVYAPPTLALSVTDQDGADISTLTEFPFFIKGLAGPNTQMPIGYNVTITANSSYTTVNEVGEERSVVAGEAVYSRYLDTNDPLLLEMTPTNVDLMSGIDYTITAIASMNSGLTATSTTTMGVEFDVVAYDIEASVYVDPESFIASISPYCVDPENDYAPVTGMHMSVYRKEFDGTFTEIMTGIDPSLNTTVTDPHPSLDYARYRIVAIDDTTGGISFYDPPGYPVKAVPAILQWNEEWKSFDTTNLDGDEETEPTWTGSMLKLPYNIDVADNNTPDSTLVNYIGRRYPVSYYGTAIDSTSTWNMAIDREDTETIYQLRRLAIWAGDVYVREPSGSGYWANVTVSFSRKHSDLTIPVTLDITRVDGGM